MYFKEGKLYKAKKDISLIKSIRGDFKLPTFDIKKDQILLFLKWDTGWLTKNKIVKYFLINNEIVFDSYDACYRPAECFEEIETNDS